MYQKVFQHLKSKIINVCRTIGHTSGIRFNSFNASSIGNETNSSLLSFNSDNATLNKNKEHEAMLSLESEPDDCT